MATLHDTSKGGGSSSSTTTSAADTLAVTAGDLVVAAIKHEGTATTATFDTGASTPTFDVANAHFEAGFGDLGGAVASWIATSTGTVTVRCVLGAARAFRSLKCYSFTPAASKTLELGNVAADEGSGTSFSAGSASATDAGVATVFLSAYGSIGLTPGSGWSEAAEHNESNALTTEYQLVSGSGSLTGNGTNGNQDWIAQMAIFTEVSAGGTDALTADDVQSTSNVTSPAVGQVHAILANDVQSTSNVTSPAVHQVHALLANDVESTSEVSAPAVLEVTPLTADDVESASSVTSPALGQVHALLATSIQSTSSVTSPAVGQVHALLAADVESASEVSAPTLAEGVHILLADDVESASSVTSPVLGQVHALTATSVQSTSSVSAPSLNASAVVATRTRIVRTIPTTRYVPEKSPYDSDPKLRVYIERELQAVARALPGSGSGNILGYGADPGGSRDSAPAIDTAISRDGFALLPPGGVFLIGSRITVPEGSAVIQMPGERATVRKGFNGDMFEVGSFAMLDGFDIDGDQDNWTGRGVIITTGTNPNGGNQKFRGLRVFNTESYNVEYTADGVGFGSRWLDCEFYLGTPNAPTLGRNDGFCIKLPTDSSTGNRQFVSCNAVADSIMDIAGAANTSLIDCFSGRSSAASLWCLGFDDASAQAKVVGSRLAGGGQTGSIKGTLHALVGNTTAGDINFALGATSCKFLADVTGAVSITDSSGSTGSSANEFDTNVASYSPTWTGASSDPALGDGSLSGSSVRRGRVCTLSFDLTIGTTTTFGSGAWRFSLPWIAHDRRWVGAALIKDASTGTQYPATVLIEEGNATYCTIHAGGSVAAIQDTVPFSWANGDRINGTIHYDA